MVEGNEEYIEYLKRMQVKNPEKTIEELDQLAISQIVKQNYGVLMKV